MNLNQCPPKQLKKIKHILFDIDDTFSGSDHHNPLQPQITAQAYAALWQLYQAGFTVIAVTGRPAGWCDLIARMWPVSYVVGENGAFYCWLEAQKNFTRLNKKYLESASVRQKNQKKLALLKAKLIKKFKPLQVASDQNYREFDLAVDYCEDVKRWPAAKVQDLINYCTQQKAQVKLSSIHVNIWYGSYDKLTCIQNLFKNELAIDCQKNPQLFKTSTLYIGDSPNDEPFFATLPFSVGVANVKPFLTKMKAHPRYITQHHAGAGFAEMADLLLALKKS